MNLAALTSKGVFFVCFLFFCELGQNFEDKLAELAMNTTKVRQDSQKSLPPDFLTCDSRLTTRS